MFHASRRWKVVFLKSHPLRSHAIHSSRSKSSVSRHSDSSQYHSPSTPDLHQFIKYGWPQFEAKGLLRQHQQKDIDNVKDFSPLQWTVSTWNVVEDIAIQQALTGMADTLYACLLWYIRQRKSTSVIKLYERFMETLGSQELIDSQRKEIFEDSDRYETSSITRAENNSSATSFHPDRSRVLLALIAAHAMEDSFINALRACLSTTVRFHPYTTTAFLTDLQFLPELRDKVQQYIEKLEIGQLVARQTSLSKQISDLSKGKDIKRMLKIYHEIIQGISGQHPYITTNLSAQPDLPVSMSDVGWCAFLAGFLRCERQDLTSDVWKDLRRLRIPPTTGMWTILLEGFDASRETAMALASWRTMLSEGAKPNALSYRAIISVLFKNRQKDEAMAKFEEFRANEEEFTTPLKLAVYNTVINGLLRTGSLTRGMLLLTEMQNHGPKPDVTTYNTFLGYYHRRGDFKGLSRILNDMITNDFKGDVFTFCTVLSALLKIGRKDAADVVIKSMKQQGIQPNAVIFTTLIKDQMKQQTEDGLRVAFALLDKMEGNPTIQFNEVTYTAILNGLYRSRWLSPDKTAMYQKEVLRRMRSRGIKFGLPIYHTILKACFSSVNDTAIKDALSYYDEMKKRDIRFAQDTWYILLAGLASREEWETAREIVNDMASLGVKPSATISRLIATIRARTY